MRFSHNHPCRANQRRICPLPQNQGVDDAIYSRAAALSLNLFCSAATNR